MTIYKPYWLFMKFQSFLEMATHHLISAMFPPNSTQGETG